MFRSLALVAACLSLAVLCTSVASAERLVELSLPSRGDLPPGAPDTIAHVPTRFDAERPWQLVVFLHGFSSCTRALVASEPTPCAPGEQPQYAYQLARSHEGAVGNTLLLVPQQAYRARRSEAPRFETSGGFDRWLGEALRALNAAGGWKLRAPDGITLVAHSAGYRAAAGILADERRVAHVTSVVLLDALYAQWDVFARWFGSSSNVRLVSLFTRAADTTRGNQRLARLLAQRLPKSAERSLERCVRADPLCLARVDTAHRMLPQLHMRELLRALFAERRDEEP